MRFLLIAFSKELLNTPAILEEATNWSNEQLQMACSTPRGVGTRHEPRE